MSGVIPPGQPEALLGALEQARQYCGAAEATLWVPGSEGQLRACLNVGATPERLRGLEVPIQATLVGWVWVSSQALCAGPDAAYFPGVAEATGTETLAMIALPVVGELGVLGILSAINPVDRACFNARDLESLMAPAAQLGSLLDGDPAFQEGRQPSP
jgi:hypothetical protein